MNTLLPYLNNLRSTMSNLSAAVAAEPSTAAQAAIASRLLDHMLAQKKVAPQLIADAYATMAALLPQAEKLLGPQNQLNGLNQLQALCSAADTDAFDHFLQVTSELQRKLLALDTSAATTICKSIVAIESGYSRQFEAAVSAQAAESARVKLVSSARNAKTYDEKALLDFIRRSFPNEPDIAIKESGLVSGGFSKFTLSITLSNAKSLPNDIILRGDAATTFGGASVVNEYGLIKTIHEHRVCVPRPLALETSGKVIGSPFMLVEKRPSTVIGHQFSQPKPNKAVGDDIAGNLAAIHRVPLAALGTTVSGADMRSSEKITGWIEQGYNSWKAMNMPSPVFETAFEWLRCHVSVNDKAPRTLVHGDFVLNNILTHDDKVSAILDWEFAHIGNPAYDFGYSFFMASSLEPWDDYLAAYARAGGAVPDEAQINYHILLAATRLGAMICQVAGAFTSGADTGIAGAAVVGDNYYEEIIRRITVGLDRVL